MTQHELLAFVSGLHAHIEQTVANKGPWCWPTRELVLENLTLNHDFWGPNIPAELMSGLDALKRKHWAVLGGCTDHCHADHVRLTAAGLEALRLMNEQGCDGHHLHRKARGRQRCQITEFAFRRKVA